MSKKITGQISVTLVKESNNMTAITASTPIHSTFLSPRSSDQNHSEPLRTDQNHSELLRTTLILKIYIIY